jgi:hypothetical protein
VWVTSEQQGSSGLVSLLRTPPAVSRWMQAAALAYHCTFKVRPGCLTAQYADEGWLDCNDRLQRGVHSIMPVWEG